MKTVHFMTAVVTLALALGAHTAVAQAQSRKSIDTPSIMTPEPGERAMPRRPARGAERDSPREEIERTEPPEPGQKPKRRTRGSSGSPLPPPRSVVTPLGTAPRVIETPSVASPSSPSQIVPEISSNTGPAVTPPRPAGQGFQDRAINCVHTGSASGVGPGQIGAYTQSCVNQ